MMGKKFLILLVFAIILTGTNFGCAPSKKPETEKKEAAQESTGEFVIWGEAENK